MNVSTAPLNIPLAVAHLPTEAAREQKLQRQPIPEPKHTFGSLAARTAPSEESKAESPQIKETSSQSKQRVAEKEANGRQQEQEQQAKQQAQQEAQEQKIVTKLKAREREVIAHEQAHASVGGQYAGAPSYDYHRGPDGRRYIVGGEVSIETSPVPNDPQATLQKAEVIRRAALAPANPSNQDRRVAADAAAMALKAKADIAKLQRQQQAQKQEALQQAREEKQEDQQELESTSDEPNARENMTPTALRLQNQLSFAGVIDSPLNGAELNIAV